MPVRVLSITVKQDGVAICEHGQELGRAKTFDGMKVLAARINLNDTDCTIFSSSMDFPEESTSDPEVLALVEILHGNAPCPETKGGVCRTKAARRANATIKDTRMK